MAGSSLPFMRSFHLWTSNVVSHLKLIMDGESVHNNRFLNIYVKGLLMNFGSCRTCIHASKCPHGQHYLSVRVNIIISVYMKASPWCFSCLRTWCVNNCCFTWTKGTKDVNQHEGKLLVYNLVVYTMWPWYTCTSIKRIVVVHD